MRDLHDMYSRLGSVERVANELGLSSMTAWRRLKVAGVRLISQGERIRGKTWSKARRAKTPLRKKKRSRQEYLESFIGNKTITSHGYVRVNLGRRKRQYEHIIVAEKILGRKLKRLERVHHVYGDRKDNKNLIICTHAYHLALHARMRKHPHWSQFFKKERG